MFLGFVGVFSLCLSLDCLNSDVSVILMHIQILLKHVPFLEFSKIEAKQDSIAKLGFKLQ